MDICFELVVLFCCRRTFPAGFRCNGLEWKSRKTKPTFSNSASQLLCIFSIKLLYFKFWVLKNEIYKKYNLYIPFENIIEWSSAVVYSLVNRGILVVNVFYACGVYPSIKISRKSFFAVIHADKMKNKNINSFTTASWGRFVKFIQNTGQKELFDIFSPPQTHGIPIDKVIVKPATLTTSIF